MFTVEQVAQICHEANRALCAVNGEASQRSWATAKGWQRESSISGVTWRLANLDAPDSAQHGIWYAERVAAGWVYGPVKDTMRKINPCLVPFDQLPVDQKAKDSLFTAIVRAFAPLME